MNEKKGHNCWYFAGSDFFKSPNEQSDSYLIPLKQINTYEKISCISYVKKSKFLYFTAPEYPRRISWVSIDTYTGISNLENGLLDDEVQLNQFEIESGEIIAMTSSSNQLFILVVERGRRNVDNSYKILQLDVDKDEGFCSELNTAIVYFGDHITNHDNNISIGIDEKRPGSGYCIYFYGSSLNRKAIFSYYTSEDKIKPQVVMLKEVLNKIPKIDLLHIVKRDKTKTESKNYYSELLIYDSTDNKYYIINHFRNNINKISQFTIATKFPESIIPSAIGSLTIDLSDFSPPLRKPASSKRNYYYSEQKTNFMFLIANQKEKNIFSISSNGEVTRIIGGGTINIFNNKIPSFSLFAYKIEKNIDTLLSINDFGIIAGTKKTSNWFTTLLPSAAEFKKINNLRKSTLGSYPSYPKDNYDFS